MAVLKKTLFAENLENYSVLIQDTDPNSTYFKITELPDTFTGGKNAFLIQGSEFLVADTLVKIEIKDAKGNIIYHEPGEGIPEYYEGTSKVIAVYIYPDTAFGPCTITILGEVSEYITTNGIIQPVPLQYKDTYNVRWQKQINVNPFLQNSTKIRFYRRPEVAITEVLKPVFTITETRIAQGGNARLYPTDAYTFSEFTQLRGQYVLPDDLEYFVTLLNGQTFQNNMLGQTMSFSSYPTYEPEIIEIISSNTAKVNPPLIENDIVQTVISTPYSVTYLSGSDRTQSQFTSSYANIKLTNLETFAGDVKRVKVFRRSKGSISDYELVQDILLESTELLFTLNGTNRAVQPTGIFDSEVLQNYWNTDGALTATLSNSRLVNGVKLNGAGKFKYSSSLDLTAKTVYELQFDAFYSSSTASDLDVYISGSTHTNSSSIDELKIGTLKGIIPTKKFENQIIQFKLDVNEPSASLYFSASQGEWHLSDVSLVISGETAFSPDSVTFLTSIPTSVPNEIFEFKFEFYDVNNNFVPVTVFEEKQFSGGTNTVIVLTQIASSSAEISSSLLAVSQSISGTMTAYSSSASSSILTLSSSVSTSVLLLTGSISSSLSSSIGYTSASVTTLSGSVSSSINVVSGSVVTLSGSVSGSIYTLSGSVSGSIYNLSGSVSTSLSNVSSSISTSLANANSQSAYTVLSASAYLDKYIFTDENGKIRRPPTASVAGLYTGQDHLGFYSGSSWKTYMDNQGDFYLTSSIVGGGFLAWSSAQGRLQVQGDINIQGGNAATTSSLNSATSSLLNSINSATASLSSSLYNSIFTNQNGQINKPPTVLVGTSNGLFLGSTYMGYYSGSDWKTYMANNGNFYLTSSVAGGGYLVWDSATATLQIKGSIDIVSGPAYTTLTNLNSTTSSLNSSVTNINSTTASINSSLTNINSATSSLDARIFTNSSGLINKTPSTTSAGLYLGSSYLGYYNGSSWKTYMANNGNFYLSGTGTDSLTWDGSTLTINGAITVTGGNAATTTQVNTAASNAVTSGSNAASNAVASGSASAAAAQTAAQLFATGIGNNAVLSGSNAASNAVTSGSNAAAAAQAAAIAQAKTDASASVNLLANGNWTGGNGTFITSTSISSPIIAGNGGYISGLFVVGSGGAITLDGINKKMYIGTGTYNNTNTSFYVDNSGQFSLKDKLTWDGTTLTVNGAINVTGGNAQTAITNLNSATSSLQSSVSTAQSTANTAVSNAATAQSTANSAQSQLTTIGSNSGSWVNPSSYNFGGSGFALANAAPAGSGLYLGANYLGYYNGSSWKSYMDNSGNFGLQGSAGYLTWTAATDALSIKGDITATNITATNTGNIAGWGLTSDSLTKTTGSFSLRLTTESNRPAIVIRETNSVDYLDRLRINADLTIPAVSVSDTGSIGYSNNSQYLATVYGTDPQPYADGNVTDLGAYGGINYGYGYGIIGLQYASEEIFVESETFPNINNVLSGDDGGDYILGYWQCYMQVSRYPTGTDAQNQTNIDTTYGYNGYETVLLASSYLEQYGGGTPSEINSIYGGTVKAPGGGGINTLGTAKWYRVEIIQYYSLWANGNYSYIRCRRPANDILVKYGRVGNGYSIFSPGGIQVYQGFKNYMNAADVSAKAAGLDAEAAAQVNFFEVKGKSGIIGSLSVSQGLTGKSKQFKIQHPVVEDKWLYHTALEGPKADLIYRGNCELIDGFASCSIDSASRMTEGTFEALTKNPQLFLQNDSGFDRVRGNVFSGSVQIYSENSTSTDLISWMVVAERKDPDVANTPLYDKNGNYKPEKYKQEYISKKIEYLKNRTSGSI
jgi:hypothetical protein